MTISAAPFYCNSKNCPAVGGIAPWRSCRRKCFRKTCARRSAVKRARTAKLLASLWSRRIAARKMAANRCNPLQRSCGTARNGRRSLSPFNRQSSLPPRARKRLALAAVYRRQPRSLPGRIALVCVAASTGVAGPDTRASWLVLSSRLDWASCCAMPGTAEAVMLAAWPAGDFQDRNCTRWSTTLVVPRALKSRVWCRVA